MLAPEDCKFAALSYVWGSSAQPDLPFQEDLPEQLPLTVDDAIECTKAIGLSYLWVDRYCIDQDDATTKHTLINNMDNIYRNAHVTIINAAGDNADYGLPGVSRTNRSPQTFVKIGTNRLCMMPNAKKEVDQSKWCTRGWTYQEGLIPNRRLLFTESQIYFQCSQMHCCEGFAHPFKTDELTDMILETLGSSMQIFPSQTVGMGAGEIFGRIEEYLRRDLSYDTDILNAFIGILQQGRLSSKPICHMWGLPWAIGPIDNSYKEESFLKALMWIPRSMLYQSGTGWHTLPGMRDMKRRPEFPSWTWAAWQGIRGIYESYKEEAEHFDVGVRVVRSTGKPINLAHYTLEAASSRDIYRTQPRLYLTGWIAYVRLDLPESLDEGQQTVRMDAMHPSSLAKISTATILTPAVLEARSRGHGYFDTETWPVLLMLSPNGLRGQCNGLVLNPVKANAYERVGVLNLSLFEKTKMYGQNVACIRQPGWNAGVRSWECTRQTIELV